MRAGRWGRSTGRGHLASSAAHAPRPAPRSATCPTATSAPTDDYDATFQIRIGDIGRTWEVRARGQHCEVRPSPTRKPDVVIGTDASTWLALREGRLSGLDAFSQRRLYARGDLDVAVGFEGLFRLPGDRDPLLRIADVRDRRRPRSRA